MEGKLNYAEQRKTNLHPDLIWKKPLSQYQPSHETGGGNRLARGALNPTSGLPTT